MPKYVKKRKPCDVEGCRNTVQSASIYCKDHSCACPVCGKRISGYKRTRLCRDCFLDDMKKIQFSREALDVILDYEIAAASGWEPEFCRARIKAIREQYID